MRPRAMNTRISIGKSQRFRIFTRDNFTCRYCGRQSDVVKLEIDHLVPVCQGGTNDEENLLTACEDCNRGKGGKTIPQHAPTELDRLRLSQERNEQLAAFEHARQSVTARAELRQLVVNQWCEASGRTEVNKATISTMLAYVKEFGPEKVFEWFARAGWVTDGSDSRMGKYVSGCARQERDKAVA